jgi:D-amino-acid dehydrogenase
LALSQASVKLFDALADHESWQFGYERRGGLYLYRTEGGLEKGVAEAELLGDYGIETQVLDAAGVRALAPSIQPTVIGGICYPEDAHLIPDRFVHSMARRVEERGVCVRTKTEVLSFEMAGRRIAGVVTTRGTFRPEQIALATGAWAPAVVREVGLRLPVQPAKGYSITFESPPDAPRIPLHLDECKVAVTPMGDMLRFGGTLELAGHDLSINQQRVAAIRRAAGEYLTGTENLQLIEVWRGLRPLTPDTLPIIGRSKAVENLVVAGGHGMLGVSLGPITGKLVAQIVAGEAPAIDLTLLGVERFQ